MKNSQEDDVLLWLQSWVQKHNNGDWEHQHGVEIDTLDNPGWKVNIDLAETELSSKNFVMIDEDHGKDDWLMCRVQNGKFDGAGDTTKLQKILMVFRDWALS